MDGGRLIAKVIAKQGVDVVFTLCGGHISPILSGCKAEGIRVVDVRHEVNAVFAADAVARMSGLPGVAAVTAGPGMTNTITAVKNAAMAQSPLVLLGGSAPTVLKGRGALQDIDQMALMRPLCKWTGSIRRIKDIVPKVEEAFLRATEGVPGPVFLECPIDTLYDEALVREWYGAAGGKNPKTLAQKALKQYLHFHLNRIFNGKDRHPEPRRITNADLPRHSQSEVQRVLSALLKAERPVFVLGSQALLQTEQVAALAQALGKLGIPCYLSGMARGLLGAQHPLLMRHKRREALREADLVLLAGVPCDFRLDYGNHLSRARYLSVNRSREDLNKNKRPSIGVLADPGPFLIALAAAAKGPAPAWAGWRAKLAERDQQREQEIDAQATDSGGMGINPLQLFRELNKQLDDRAVLVADGGDFVGTGAYTLHARTPLSWLDPGAFGTLGVGGGFALGAKLVRPDSEVWIIWGDGSSAYSLAEFDTYARHGIPVIGLIGNDACWAQIARDQVEILKDDVAVMLAHTDYDQVAKGYGGDGVRVDNLPAFLQAIEQARASVRNGKPFLINAILAKSDFRKGSISM
ncbi:MAG: thiamine pyrophosphate-binding protein [Bacteroidetes bacterium]|nr:thiamine pyrophosphate-binding protein [Bacteroidota bacterium]